MGKKFTFTSDGISSRSYYLAKIRDGANTVNTLKASVKKSWYDANQAVRILEEEKLIENISTNTYPKYQLTTWGEQEAKRFDTWNSPVATGAPVSPTKQPAPGLNEHHTVPEVPNQPVQTIATAAESVSPPKQRLVNRPDPGGSPRGIWVTEGAPVRPDPLAVAKFVADAAVCDKQHVKPEDGYLTAYNELLHEQFGDQISFKDVLARMAT